MNRVTLAYLSSFFFSWLGNSVALIALPLIILSTTGSVLSTGIVAASSAIPAIFAGLFMGALIDRWNRRTASIVFDALSAVAIGLLPVVDYVFGLNLWWFIVLGMIGAIGDVPAQTAREALLPGIVKYSSWSVERLVGTREALSAVAMITGPALAGVMVAALNGPTILWITAGFSFTACLISFFLPQEAGSVGQDIESGPDTMASSVRQIVIGWKAIGRSRVLLMATSLSFATATLMSGLQGLILPSHFYSLDKESLTGFVLTAIAIGVLVGASTYSVCGTYGSRSIWFGIGLIGMSFGFTTIAPLGNEWFIFVGGFVIGLSSGLISSLLGVVMLEHISESLRGRIMGTQNALLTCAPALGIMCASLITEQWSEIVAASLLTALWSGLAIVVFAKSRHDVAATKSE